MLAFLDYWLARSLHKYAKVLLNLINTRSNSVCVYSIFECVADVPNSDLHSFRKLMRFIPTNISLSYRNSSIRLLNASCGRFFSVVFVLCECELWVVCCTVGSRPQTLLVNWIEEKTHAKNNSFTHFKMKSYCERTKAVNIRFPRAGWSELAARVKSATEDKTKKTYHFNKAIESILVIFPWVLSLTYSMLFTQILLKQMRMCIRMGMKEKQMDDVI